MISKELPLKPEPNTEVPEAIREDNNTVKVMLWKHIKENEVVIKDKKNWIVFYFLISHHTYIFLKNF